MKTDESAFVSDYEATSYTFEYEHSGFVPEKLFQYAHGTNVLDLGCGPVLNVLGLFFRQAKEIVGLDKSDYNIAFLRNLIATTTITENQRRAFKFLKDKLDATSENSAHNIDSAHALEGAISNLYEKISLFQGDVLTEYPDLLNRFDSVVQSGCFGCLKDEKEFELAVANAYSYTRPGGKLLMINWLQNEFREKPFNFNGSFSSRLNEETYERAFKSAGFKLEIIERSHELTSRSREQGNVAILWAVAVK